MYKFGGGVAMKISVISTANEVIDIASTTVVLPKFII